MRLGLVAVTLGVGSAGDVVLHGEIGLHVILCAGVGIGVLVVVTRVTMLVECAGELGVDGEFALRFRYHWVISLRSTVER